MNLLAHAYLGFDHPERVVGQIAGDFVKGKDLSAYPETIQEGIRLHRALDSWTDRHRVFIQSRSRFATSRRRVAGIMVDLLYDHALARHWSNFSQQALSEYAAEVYRLLSDYRPLLPAKMHRFIENSRKLAVFEGYQSLAGVERAVLHISKRMQMDALFDGVMEELPGLIPGIDRDFAGFFPEAIQHTQELLAKESLRKTQQTDKQTP